MNNEEQKLASMDVNNVKTRENKDICKLDDNTYIPWISVTDRLPERPEYDWVLVRIEYKEGGTGIPHIAELVNGVWQRAGGDGDMEETLAVKVTHWKPIPDEDVK